MKPQTFHMTQEGLDELKAELAQLQKDKHPQAVDRVRLAREHGDLSENSEYHAAREDLAMVEGRIDELEELISKAKIMPKASNSVVSVGNKVTIKTSKDSHTYHIVGKYEADPMNKKISDESPLGQALLGKKEGEEVEYEAPVGKVIYHIQKIH